MAHLSIVGSHKVNGVSALHSELLVKTIFADFAQLWPERFTNVTNGVTPRRWLAQANPGLAALLDATLGGGWRLDLGQLERAARRMPTMPSSARASPRSSATTSSGWRATSSASAGVALDPASLFDVQIKRIHEYKRQLLNVLHVVARYQRSSPIRTADWVPRTRDLRRQGGFVLRHGQADHPAHQRRRARWSTATRACGGRLKVVFVPNYGVSVAEIIMPGADLSEQISTAGTEASGTGNMKLALNGALTIGTEDGANIEIRDSVGADNIFIFGHSADGVAELNRSGYQPMRLLRGRCALKRALDAIAIGAFSPDEPDRYRGLVDALLWGGDHYKLLADFDAYLTAQARVDALYRDGEAWSTLRHRQRRGDGRVLFGSQHPRVRDAHLGCRAEGAGKVIAPPLEPGRAWPLGASCDAPGINFAVFSAHAEAIELCAFDAAGERELWRRALPARSGDIRHGHLAGAAAGFVYALRAHGPFRPEAGHRFDAHRLLLDPYAREIAGGRRHGPERARVVVPPRQAHRRAAAPARRLPRRCSTSCT